MIETETDQTAPHQLSEMLEDFQALPRPEKPRLRVHLAFLIYQLFAALAVPFAIGHFLWISRDEKAYRQNMSHRLGLGPIISGEAVWIFAASLGETRAVSPVVRKLVEAGFKVCLTSSTAAGLTEAKRLFSKQPNQISIRYAPLDFIAFVWLFLSRQKPRVGLVVEGELWPGYLLLCRWLGIPLLKVNGNLIQRSVERDLKRLGGVRLEFMRQYHAILTKTPSYKERYVRANVASERVFCVGELKFDQWKEPLLIEIASKKKQNWSPNNPVVMIASSVEEEEAELHQFVQSVLAHSSKPKIIWVPRSPRRFDAVAREVSQYQTVGRRSKLLSEEFEGEIDSDLRVIVGDTIGEMDFYYQMADLVFVGATIAPRGGHNIVEPLALERPVLVGPSIIGIVYPALDARDAGALYIADDIDDLIGRTNVILSDPIELKRVTELTQRFSAAHLGASDRTVELVKTLIANPMK